MFTNPIHPQQEETDKKTHPHAPDPSPHQPTNHSTNQTKQTYIYRSNWASLRRRFGADFSRGALGAMEELLGPTPLPRLPPTAVVDIYPIACFRGLDACRDAPAELLALDDGQVRSRRGAGRNVGGLSSLVSVSSRRSWRWAHQAHPSPIHTPPHPHNSPPSASSPSGPAPSPCT